MINYTSAIITSDLFGLSEEENFDDWEFHLMNLILLELNANIECTDGISINFYFLAF